MQLKEEEEWKGGRSRRRRRRLYRIEEVFPPSRILFYLFGLPVFFSRLLCLFAQKQVTINYKPRWPSHRSSSPPSAVGAVTRSYRSTRREIGPSFLDALNTHTRAFTATTTWFFFIFLTITHTHTPGRNKGGLFVIIIQFFSVPSFFSAREFNTRKISNLSCSIFF